MYQKTVKLNISEELVVEWESNWSNLSIRMRDVLIGKVLEKSALKVGRRFTLPNRKSILVVLSDFGLEIWHEGREFVGRTTSSGQDEDDDWFWGLCEIILEGWEEE